jgi:glycosyltransferase involved in cell wall biosynthesis
MTRPAPNRRLAVVVQRYGDSVNGGAEAHARLLVRALSPHAQIDVLTSRAIDYRDWIPTMPAGIELQDGTRVIRFDHPPAARGRDRHTPIRHKLRFAVRRWLDRSQPMVLQPSGNPVTDGERFLVAQGPTMPGLLQWLREHGTQYSALFFMTARFHPSAMGVFMQPRRSVLIPTLHEEKAMFLPHFHRVFRAPRHILYNTGSEQRLAHRLYGADLASGSVCGIGVDFEAASTPSALPPAATGAAPYLLYLGRVDRGKNCDSLFRQFRRWADDGGTARLLVAGKLAMTPPTDPRIEYVGFVDERGKWALLHNATALVIPSRKESLSMVLLEALAAGTPVIANRDSEVLADHLRAAGIGFTYSDDGEFAAALRALLQRDDRQREADRQRGRTYVQQHYAWPVITRKLLDTIEQIEADRGV